jgi:hypothetical protein
VLGLAVRVDGRRPIGARARRILEPELWLAVGPRQEEMAMKIVCRSLDDLQDYCQPHSPGQDTPGYLLVGMAYIVSWNGGRTWRSLHGQLQVMGT